MVDPSEDDGSYVETAEDAREETIAYLSLAGMTPEGGDQYPVDRSRSIFELIDERKFSLFVKYFDSCLNSF